MVLLSFWTRVELQALKCSLWVRLCPSRKDSRDGNALPAHNYCLLPAKAILMAFVNCDISHRLRLPLYVKQPDSFGDWRI